MRGRTLKLQGEGEDVMSTFLVGLNEKWEVVSHVCPACDDVLHRF